MKKAYIGLGSNLGDRLINLKGSLDLLLAEPDIDLVSCSNVYMTDPVGGPEQESFLNACISINTCLTPVILLQKMLSVEDKMKRVRKEKWGPRIIDLDLLIYEGIKMNTPVLKLPHPHLEERDFVLIPLSDIAPNLFLPGKDKNIKDVITNRKDTNTVIFYCHNNWYRSST